MTKLVPDKTDFKTKTIKRYKEGHHIKVKGPIHQEDITLINICAPNIRTSKHMKQTLTTKIHNSGFQYPFSTMDRTSKQNINKKTEERYHQNGKIRLFYPLLPKGH